MTTTNQPTTTRPRITVEALGDFYRRAFEAVDCPPEDAATVARVLLAADTRGIESHGAPLARGYTRRIRRGLINPRPDIRVVTEWPGTLVLDSDDGLGPVVGDYAMRRAIEKAATNGVGTVTVRNSNHYASCFYYPTLAIEAGMAGLTITTSGPLVLPTFGAAHLVGPFYALWWYENPERPIATLMDDNRRKALFDWEKKIVLPEARAAFAARHRAILERCGDFPRAFLDGGEDDGGD